MGTTRWKSKLKFNGSAWCPDDTYLYFGDDNDVSVTWDGTNLIVAAAADDTLIEIGDAAATQKSFDVKIYGDGANGADYLHWDASANELKLVGDANIVREESASQAVFQSRATVSYTDTSAKTLFTIPAGADIIGIIVDVTTAFNDSGTDLLDIGTSSDGDYFKNDLDVSSVGQTMTGWSHLGDVGSSDITVTATYTGQNGDASAGQATVIFLWTVS